MDDAALLADALEQVVARIGDPAPRVFARLFAESPDLQALFVNDTSGSVREKRATATVHADQVAGQAEGADGGVHGNVGHVVIGMVPLQYHITPAAAPGSTRSGPGALGSVLRACERTSPLSRCAMHERWDGWGRE